MLLESFKFGADFPLIVFDLDGTLLNSLPATFNALRAVISPRIGREVRIKDMLHLINNTDLEILREMAGQDDYQGSPIRERMVGSGRRTNNASGNNNPGRLQCNTDRTTVQNTSGRTQGNAE